MRKKNKLKPVETQIGKNVTLVMPMIEEISSKGLNAVCLIGFAWDADASVVRTCFSTLNTDADKVTYGICKAYVEALKDKYDDGKSLKCVSIESNSYPPK